MNEPALPSRVYIDTSFVIASLFAGVAHYGPCRAFGDRLRARGTQVYYSQLLRLEITQAIKNVAVRQPPQLPEPLRVKYHLDQWTTSPPVRRRWMRFGLSELTALLTSFRSAVEVPLTEAMCVRSARLMTAYDLKSYDALHAATARAQRLRDFATTDREFQAVRELRLWLMRDPSPPTRARPGSTG